MTVEPGAATTENVNADVEAPNLGTTDPKTTAAPPAEPAAATTPAAKPEPAKEPSITYESTGNSNADYALAQIGAAGIGPDHPAAAAALAGDFTLLKHALAAKGVPGSDHLVAMLEKAAVDEAEREEAVAQQINEDVLAMAGSQEHWTAVMDWGRANADPEEKETLNELFSSTKTHKIAAAYLLSAYDRAGGVKEQTGTVASPDAAEARAGTQGRGEPLNRVQFAAEAAKLRKTMGDGYINSKEYAQLGARLVR